MDGKIAPKIKNVTDFQLWLQNQNLTVKNVWCEPTGFFALVEDTPRFVLPFVSQVEFTAEGNTLARLSFHDSSD
jgi:hypothetical protein